MKKILLDVMLVAIAALLVVLAALYIVGFLSDANTLVFAVIGISYLIVSVILLGVWLTGVIRDP